MNYSPLPYLVAAAVRGPDEEYSGPASSWKVLAVTPLRYFICQLYGPDWSYGGAALSPERLDDPEWTPAGVALRWPGRPTMADVLKRQKEVRDTPFNHFLRSAIEFHNPHARFHAGTGWRSLVKWLRGNDRSDLAERAETYRQRLVALDLFGDGPLP